MSGAKRELAAFLQDGDFYRHWIAGKHGGGGGEYDVIVTGQPPITLPDSVGKPLVEWSMTGNILQNGTPSPDNAVEVKGVGNKTGNWFDERTLIVGYQNADWAISGVDSNQYRCIDMYLPAGTYTWHAPESYVVRSNINGVYSQTKHAHMFTFTVNEYSRISISFRNNPLAVWTDRPIMLNSGSTPIPYEPYGYKIEVLTKGKNLCPPLVAGLGLNSSSGVEISNRYGFLSDYIPIDFDIHPKYVLSNVNYALHNFVAVYNENKEFVGRTGGNNANTLTLYDGYFGGGTPTATGKKKFIRVYQYALTDKKTDDFVNKLMLVEGDVAQTYEPYHSPIKSPFYLPTPLMANEVLRSDGEREVEWGKYICTGDENWNNQQSRYDSDEKSMFSLNIFTQAAVSTLAKTSHFRWYTASQQISAPAGTFAQNQAEATKNYFYFNISNAILGVTKDSTLAEKQDAMKQWVKSQYEAGTPVTIWYKLADPVTTTVSVPSIPTFEDTTIIDVDTEVKPTSMTATYKSKKPDTAMAQYLGLLKEV